MPRRLAIAIALLLLAAAAPARVRGLPPCQGEAGGTWCVYTPLLITPSGPTPAPPPPPTATPAPPAPPKPFYAFYYLWWSTRHWQTKLGSGYPWDGSWPLPGSLSPASGCGATAAFPGGTVVDLPAGGAYDQPTSPPDLLDQSIYAEHVRLAAAAGLTGFLAAWSGTGLPGEAVTDSGYNKRLDLLVKTVRSYNLGADQDFSYIVDYETFKEIRTPEQIGNDLSYLLASYGDDPAWGRLDGRPIVYWHSTKSFPTPTLEAIHRRFGSQLFIIGEERATTWSAQRAQFLEGSGHYWSSQNPYVNPLSFRQMRAFADQIRADGRLWFAPLAPGYNDELHAAVNGVGTGNCVSRKGVETMRRLYTGNRDSRPDGWFVISWNEWVEHTYIEPSRRYGSLYLDELTRIIAEERAR